MHMWLPAPPSLGPYKPPRTSSSKCTFTEHQNPHPHPNPNTSCRPGTGLTLACQWTHKSLEGLNLPTSSGHIILLWGQNLATCPSAATKYLEDQSREGSTWHT